MSRPARLAALLAALSATAAGAAPVTLMFGEGDRRASFTFAEDRAAADALVIETHRVGNPGAELRIWIDRNPRSLVSTILMPDQCGFDDAGAVCRIEIAGGTPEYAAFVTSFRRGLTAHIELRNASVMEMRDDISLDGFTAAYGD